MTMLPESPEDIFRSAYANVGLFSDTVWLVGEPDDYRKANQELWVLYHRINSLYSGEEKNNIRTFPTTREQVRTVRETIPSSRLAQYGNYQYDEDRERLYAPNYATTQHSEQCENVFETSENCDEIWMSPEVEEQFKKLTCLENSGHKLWTQPPTSFTLSKLDTLTDNEEQTPQELLKFETWASFLLDNYPKLAEYICNPQAQSLFSEDISAPYDTEPYDLNQYPAPRCTISSPEELKLNMKINSQEIKSLWNQTKPTHFQEYQSYQIKPTHRRIENPFDTNQILAHRPPPPTLNADVPEFFPKLNLHVTPMLEDENGHKYFPSAHEINDPNELFPYVHVLDKTTTERENANNFTEIPYTSTTFTVTETAGLQPCSKHSYPSFYPTSISSITGRASQQRFNSNIQHHQVSTSVYNNSHITDDTPLAFSNNSISAPRNIPVFQRPPEFYIQHQDTVANARRQGGGVDYSNLILLTRGGKTHHRGQNVKHPKMNINEMQANLIVPTNHQQSPSFLLGTDLFSDQPFRSPTKKDMSSFTPQETDSSIKEHVSLTEENLKDGNLRMDEVPTYSASVRQWLDQNYKEREDELQDLDRLIEEFLSIETELQQQINDEQENSILRTKTSIKDEGFRLMEADHFPPIVPSMLTDAISSTPTDVSSITLSTASNQDSTLSHDSTFARSSNTSGVSGKRRLYRDVLANMASVPVITPPATSVAESYVDPRFEELEREALEQYRPSDENLGQSFQQQGASDESISQRFQELERQALEQYHSSSSSIEGFLAETLGNSNVGSVENSQISPQSFSFDLEHSNPKKKDLLGLNQTQALSLSKMDTSPSVNQTTLNPAWSRGCSIGIGSNDTTKRGITSSQSHHEFPGYSGVGASTAGGVSLALNSTSNDTTIRNKPAAASKSLPAIGLTSSPTIASKHVTVPLGADGDKGGDGIQQVTPINRRRLVLIKPARNRHSLPTNIESVESGIGEVGPKLLVVARGVRGLGQNMGSTTAPRHLVTAIYDTPSPGARAIGSNLPGADGARKSKSQMQQQPHQQQQQSQQHHQQQNQSTPRNLGGGGDENPCPQQRHEENPNPNVQGTQVSIKLHPLLTNNNEGDSQCMVNSSEVVISSADCPKIPETWVQQEVNNCSQMSEKLHPTSIKDLENPSPTKPPPWMRKQRKKRPTPGNKKKRNKSSGKRGHCFRKRLKGTSSACDLTTEGDIVRNGLNASKSETNCLIISENIINYSQNIHEKNNLNKHEESENETEKDNSSDENSSSEVIKSTKQAKNKFKEYKINNIQNSSIKQKVLNKHSSRNSEKQEHSNLKNRNPTECSYIAKAIAKKLQMEKYSTTFSNNDGLSNFSVIDIFQNESYNTEFSFGSKNFISVIPHDIEIETCPQKYLSDYISDSLLETAFIVNKNIRFTRHRNIRKTIYVQKIWKIKYDDNNKNSSNIYKFNCNRINEESKLKMTQTIIDFHLTELYKNFPFDSFHHISCSNQHSRQLNSFLSLSLKDKMDSKSLCIAHRIKYTIYENLAVMRSVHILRLDHDILLICNENNGFCNSMEKNCNLKSDNFFEKMNYVKVNCILVSSTLDAPENHVVRETSNIISLNRKSSLKTLNKKVPSTSSTQLQKQLNVSNQNREENPQTMDQNLLRYKNIQEQNNLLKNTLSNSEFDMSRHFISAPKETRGEIEPKTLSPFSKANLTDRPICNTDHQDISGIFSNEKIAVPVRLNKSNKSLHMDEAGSEKNGKSDLSNDKVKDSPMILKLRQQVLQTATTIQLACGKQKAILPNVEPELTHVNKKKNEMVCCIQ